MGLLDIIKGVGKGLIGTLPGGGLINQGLDIASGLAPVLSGAAKSGAQANQNNDLLRLKAEDARLGRDKFALAAPGSRLSTGMRASAMNSAAPAQWNWGGPGSGLMGKIPTMSGGVGGAIANIDPRAKALSSHVLDDELLSQMRGGSSGQNMDAAMPDLSKIGQTSGLDKVMGGLGLGTSILAALRKVAQGSSGGSSGGGGIFAVPGEDM